MWRGGVFINLLEKYTWISSAANKKGILYDMYGTILIVCIGLEWLEVKKIECQITGLLALGTGKAILKWKILVWRI